MKFLAAIALLLGLYFASTSLTAQVMTGEHAATLSGVCILLVIAFGVWDKK